MFDALEAIPTKLLQLFRKAFSFITQKAENNPQGISFSTNIHRFFSDSWVPKVYERTCPAREILEEVGKSIHAKGKRRRR
jgi:hypothetical protein